MIRSLFSLFLLIPGVSLPDADVRRGIVLLTITPVVEDATRPWIKDQGTPFQRLGLVVGKGKILALESEVRGAAIVEVRKHSSTEAVTATIERSDRETDLAILSVPADFAQDLNPIPAGPDPVVGETLESIRVDGGLFRLQRNEVQFSEIEVTTATGFTAFPVGNVASLEPFPEGGILISKGKLAGFVHDRSNGRRIDFLLPGYIHQFLAGGAPGSAGFDYESLVDPVLRRNAGVEGRSGPMVTRIYPGTSAYGVLQKGDIILAVDGVVLDERGFFEDGKNGRQRIELLLYAKGGVTRKIGDTVPIRIIRAARRMDVSFKLIRNEGNAVRVPIREREQGFLVEGGVVFLNLSLFFLQSQFGATYATSAPELAYLYQSKRFRDQPGDDRIVIIARVLPDDMTLGYESLGGAQVLRAGNETVKSVNHLHDIMEAAAKKDATLTLELSNGRMMVLDLKNRNAINSRIRKRYGVPVDFRRASNSGPGG
ncbi:MAG TPA: hypothetical protein PKX74_00565 [Leptospiraceae bacterium]|nr:hypothetical protein [Leptospirales bacterium]HMU81979.1 hypothetical protein [Leptospiraceae bacterium]HMW58396.1 hypothetical protein [Leptospiraceae bacterium]HMY43929.1 hypothetical protein [Leptospiraceae bacterium]HNE22406.1 hypothetical protein [Leptospiraceae bacterium]